MFKKFLAVAVISAFLGSASVFAEEKKAMTLDEGVAVVQRAYPNSTIDKKEKEKGLLEYYIKTDKGEKVLVKIDPKTGEIVSPKQEKKEEPKK